MAQNPQAFTSVSLLGRLLAGLTMTEGLMPDTELADDTPDLSAGDFETDGAKVSATIHTRTGDAYRVSVEWLSEASP